MRENSFEKAPSVEEESFKGYVGDLRLTPEDFNKVILDVGAGEAYFAKWAKDHNISSKIYSLEPSQDMTEKEKGIVGVAEKIPMPDEFFELIISKAAIPNIYLAEKNAHGKVLKSFSEMLRVLKEGGEIRLARVLLGDTYENQQVLKNTIEEVLNKLEDTGIKIEKTHTPENDLYEWEGHERKDLLAKSFLITLKKPISTDQK